MRYTLEELIESIPNLSSQLDKYISENFRFIPCTDGADGIIKYNGGITILKKRKFLFFKWWGTEEKNKKYYKVDTIEENLNTIILNIKEEYCFKNKIPILPSTFMIYETRSLTSEDFKNLWK